MSKSFYNLEVNGVENIAKHFAEVLNEPGGSHQREENDKGKDRWW